MSNESEVIDVSLANLVLLRYMPIYYTGLVVENTNRCNAKCAMCYQSASPDGSEILGLSRLDVEDLKRCIKQAASIETVGRRFHLAGGEAFLYFEECIDLFNTAKEVGFLDITATTNAYWATVPQKAEESCKQLRQAGVTSLEISWDYWHKPYIKPSAISNCLEACAKEEIETNLRILTSKSHSIEEALALLSPASIEFASRISTSPVFPTGRAATNIDPDEFFTLRTSLSDNCHRVLNLTINSFGNVFPCCAGIDQTKDYIVGNISDESLHTIVERMNADPVIRRIVFTGIKSLVPILEEAGFQIGENYRSICHLCWTIFSNEEYTETIKDYFAQQKRNALEKALDHLEKKLMEEKLAEINHE